MLDQIYKKIIEKHPNSLVNFQIHYSPGASAYDPPYDGVKPFFFVTVKVNGSVTYTSGECATAQREQDLDTVLKWLDAAIQ